MHEQSELNLVRLSKDGDSDAFSVLIKNYRKRLAGYLFMLCPEKSMAEDVMQETLIKAWRGFARYDEKNKFSSWLFSIAHNAAVDAIRKFNKQSVIRSAANLEIYDDREMPDAKLEVSELSRAIDNAVRSLPEKQRHVFLLRQHSELTFREIAELTGEPLNTVLGQMRLAVKKIKTFIKSGY